MRFTKDKYGFNKKNAEKIIRLMSVLQIFLMSIVILLEKGCSHLEGTPPLRGRALTNDLCGQYFKINLFISALAKINAVLAKIILMLNDYTITLYSKTYIISVILFCTAIVI